MTETVLYLRKLFSRICFGVWLCKILSILLIKFLQWFIYKSVTDWPKTINSFIDKQSMLLVVIFFVIGYFVLSKVKKMKFGIIDIFFLSVTIIPFLFLGIYVGSIIFSELLRRLLNELVAILITIDNYISPISKLVSVIWVSFSFLSYILTKEYKNLIDSIGDAVSELFSPIIERFVDKL